MLAILSPAKTLDFSPPPPGLKRTRPDLVDEAAVLVESALKPLGRAALKALLRVSDALASLNHERYQVWDRDHEGESETKQAALAFNGPAFKGLGADTLSEDELEWAQGRVRILCGLYGALRPLDAIRPYRLEMSTRVATARGPDLYSFWREYVTGHLSDALAALRADVRDDSGACAPRAFRARALRRRGAGSQPTVMLTQSRPVPPDFRRVARRPLLPQWSSWTARPRSTAKSSTGKRCPGSFAWSSACSRTRRPAAAGSGWSACTRSERGV